MRVRINQLVEAEEGGSRGEEIDTADTSENILSVRYVLTAEYKTKHNNVTCLRNTL